MGHESLHKHAPVHTRRCYQCHGSADQRHLWLRWLNDSHTSMTQLQMQAVPPPPPPPVLRWQQAAQRHMRPSPLWAGPLNQHTRRTLARPVSPVVWRCRRPVAGQVPGGVKAPAAGLLQPPPVRPGLGRLRHPPKSGGPAAGPLARSVPRGVQVRGRSRHALGGDAHKG
jgi:hypothetical protein